jgi:type VI protein secretion system component Hcp
MRISNSKLIRCVLVCVGLLLPFRSLAAYDMYLAITGVPGEATNNLIALESFQWSVAVAISTGAGGRNPGAPSFATLDITKQMDSSSPILTYDCASGTLLTSVVLTVKDHVTGNALYTLTLGNVYISAASSGGGGSDRPNESYSLNFGSIQWTYQKLDGSGNPSGSPVTHSWNLATGKGT